MRRQVSDLVRNYIRRLSDQEMHWINHRLNDRLGNDLAEVLNFMSKSSDMDRWFASSKSPNELYDMIDTVHQHLLHDHRSSNR